MILSEALGEIKTIFNDKQLSGIMGIKILVLSDYLVDTRISDRI